MHPTANQHTATRSRPAVVTAMHPTASQHTATRSRPAVVTAPRLRAALLNGKVFGWFDGARGLLDGGVILFRLQNQGTAVAKLTSPRVDLSGPRGMRRACTVGWASARAEESSAVIGQHFDYTVKPGAHRIVRIVFHCRGIAGKRTDIARGQEYRIELSMTYQKGRVVVVADSVRPMQHPAATGGI